jgi:hypothetical protein
MSAGWSLIVSNELSLMAVARISRMAVSGRDQYGAEIEPIDNINAPYHLTETGRRFCRSDTAIGGSCPGCIDVGIETSEPPITQRFAVES